MKTHITLFLILVSLFIENAYCQSTVYVNATEFGRGILKMRGSKIFVITPEHLVEGVETSFKPITIYGSGNKRQRAAVDKTFAGDLAVLRFEGESELDAEKWQLNENYSSLLNSVSEAYLELRERDGSVTIEEVSIKGIDIQFIQIKPKDPDFEIGQGNSGSSLFVQYQGRKVFLGMLQSIKTKKEGNLSANETENLGYVLRADEMDKLLSSFFNPIIKEKRSKVISEENLTREIEGLKFHLLNINKSSDRVSFTFEVTSLITDKNIKIHYGNIDLYVDDGSKYNPKTITIGNKTSHVVQYNLIKDVGTAITFVFNGISNASSIATLFQLGFQIEDEDFAIKYRDIYLGDDTEVVADQQNWSHEDLGLKFELESIFKNGTSVDFSFTVSSLYEDKTIELNWSKLLMYDDKGFESKAEKITVGNKTSHIVKYNLIQGIKVPMTISFKDVSASAKRVSLLKVNFEDSRATSVFQIRNLDFTVKPKEQIIKSPSEKVSQNNSSIANCSEIFFYRKNGMLECPETVYLYNHGELLVKLEPGVRFKSVVCDNRSFKLSVRTNPNEIALFSSSPEIEMGEKYYFKISCGMGVSAITQMDDNKGIKDINNNKKYKRRLTELQLNEY